MTTFRDLWKEGDHEGKRAVVLRALKRDKTIQALVGLLSPADGETGMILEPILEELRGEGLVLCTTKIWYRKDIPLKQAEPRQPREPTEKELRFLARQGRLF